MKLWVDADACPVVVKEILIRASERTKTPLTFVANQFLSLPKSPYVSMLQVAQGFDVADNEIVQRVEPSDHVITADIPLAAEVVDKGATALNPRGEKYTKANIRARLNMRDFMETMRTAGVETGGSPPYNQTDRRNFANALDQWLAKSKT